MPELSDQQVCRALATLSHACAAGAVPEGPAEAFAATSPEAREALGEAALAVACGAFASRGGYDGPMHALQAGLGLMAMLAGEEPDPPAEILGAAAESERVEAEIDRAGEALDAEFGREADCGAMTAALEARILGNAILLGGCTRAEHEETPDAVRLRAARILTRLAAGLLAINAAGR